ncbi:phosphoglycerate dehydrogenase [Myxococcota bacterium]|nr:phosphoglycerate dehydrogenase [Myxococcota bacterium]
MVKVLVTDSLAEAGLEVLEAADGIDLVYRPEISHDELLNAIADAHGLVVRSGTKVTEDVIAAAPELRAIGRAGIGVDNVDVPAATARGIAVMNTPGGNNVTTAEHAIALLISVARRIPQANAATRAGSWEKQSFMGLELSNRTLGVVGLGNVGRIVARLAQGLGMKVVGHDPFLTESAASRVDVELVPFEELLQRSDAITVHVPRTPDTTGLLGAEAFERTRPGVIVINAARGGIVDEQALLDALNSGAVGGAGLDVFVEEPPGADHPLVCHDKVVCTPHLGASTEQAQLNVAMAVAQQMRDFLLSGVLDNAINVPSISRERLAEIRPFLQLAERLGRMQGQLCDAAIDQVEIEYSGDAAFEDVAPITIAVLKGLLEASTDQVNMVNAPILTQQRGIKVVESKTSRSQDFASAISTRLSGSYNRLVVGAVFHGGQPRIVRIDDFMLEAIPEGPTLLIHNHDEPGVVGLVGSLLGEGGINISRMQLALAPDRPEAAMLVNVDHTPSPDVMRGLVALPQVISARALDLGS